MDSSRLNIYINFCLQVHFKVSAAWYCSHCLPLVSLTPAANLPPASLTPVANLPQVSTTLVKLVAKFAAGVVDTCGKLAAGVVGTGSQPWSANISANFRKKFEMALTVYSGAWGKMIHDKNQKQKISWHCPFNENFDFCKKKVYPKCFILIFSLAALIHVLIVSV